LCACATGLVKDAGGVDCGGAPHARRRACVGRVLSLAAASDADDKRHRHRYTMRHGFAQYRQDAGSTDGCVVLVS